MVIKAGIGGTSVFVSSGDDGVADSTARADDMGSYVCAYMPSIPATCPYMSPLWGPLWVQRATIRSLHARQTLGQPLQVEEDFLTSISSPSGKKTRGFLLLLVSKAGKLPSPGYNRNGRAIPDVSALGHAYLTVVGGNLVAVDGTSASAPVWAGLMTLINSVRQLNDVSVDRLSEFGLIRQRPHKSGKGEWIDDPSRHNSWFRSYYRSLVLSVPVVSKDSMQCRDGILLALAP